jgi:hypothetical protein
MLGFMLGYLEAVDVLKVTSARVDRIFSSISLLSLWLRYSDNTSHPLPYSLLAMGLMLKKPEGSAGSAFPAILVGLFVAFGGVLFG